MNTPDKSAQQKSDTLFGGRVVKIALLPEKEGAELVSEEVKVRQILTGEYKTLLPLILDEIALVTKICDKPAAWMNRITPESYEVLQAVAWEVNGLGFFRFAARRIKENKKLFADLPPETITEIVRQASEVKLSPSPTR